MLATERPESETGDQSLQTRLRRGKGRRPSWEDVEKWRSRWTVESVARVLQALASKSSTPSNISTLTKFPVLEEDGQQFADLRGLDVTLLPVGQRLIGAPRSPTGILDLRQINFDGARLTGLDLSFADLDRVRMRKATLRRVNFTGANLTKAHIEDADLRDVIVDDAHLAFLRYTEDGWINRGTILREINFSRALYVDPLMHRYARDQYYIYVYRYRGNFWQKAWHSAWWLTTK